MSFRVSAHFDGKAIVPDEPIELPRNQELEIEVRVVTASRRRRKSKRPAGRITSLPFFGLWANREDMKDSAAWVRKERERWSERLQSPR